MTGSRNVFGWPFRDRRTEGVVIGQFPNLPLWVAMGLFAARWVVESPDGPAGLTSALDRGFVAAIAWWARLEMAKGVNPWRRGLAGGGAGVRGPGTTRGATPRLARVMRIRVWWSH